MNRVKDTVHRQKKSRGLLIILAALVSLSSCLLLNNCSKRKANEKIKIILISVDTLRADHLSCYGYIRDTSPHLSRLVEDSVHYTKAYPNGCWTMPSHMSMLTGTLPSRHGINKSWRSIIMKRKYPKLNVSLKTIAEVLKSHNQNIRTIKFAQLPNELGFAKGFDTNNLIDPFADDAKFNEFLQVLENNKENNFFFFLHTWMVHAPYTHCNFFPRGRIDDGKRLIINTFRKKFRKKGERISQKFKKYLQENDLFNADVCETLYDGGIVYVDGCIGRIIEKTKQMGIYDDLMVIVTSDHGEHFSEHLPDDFYGCHGRDYYEEFVRVPLIIKYPHAFKRKICHHPVSGVDIFPTVLDFYDIPAPGFIQGESLMQDGSKRNKKMVISEAISTHGLEKKMILVGDLKYIITMKNPSELQRVNRDFIIQRKLFDLHADPYEKKNLQKDKKFRQICINLEKMLFKIIDDSAKTNCKQKETEITSETIKQLQELGYL